MKIKRNFFQGYKRFCWVALLALTAGGNCFAGSITCVNSGEEDGESGAPFHGDYGDYDITGQDLLWACEGTAESGEVLIPFCPHTVEAPLLQIIYEGDIMADDQGSFEADLDVAFHPGAVISGTGRYDWYIDGSLATNVTTKYLTLRFPEYTDTGPHTLKVHFYLDGDFKAPSPEFDVILNASSSYSLSFSESGGSRNRKVSLAGLPIAGQKPQQDSESDYQRAETHVDAMTLGLVHDSKDMLVPLGSSQLALGVSRSLFNESWSTDKGLTPSTRPDRPFGMCWNAGIGGSLEIVDDTRMMFGSTHFFPDYVNVTDENGQSFRFLRTDGTFVPAPVSRFDLKRYQGCDLSTNSVGYVFKKRFGTTITFEETETIFGGWEDRKYYTFCRVLSVTNTYEGVGLDYSYSVADSMIPDTITAFPSGKSLSITQSDGRIQTITDPLGHEVAYEYTNSNMQLSAVVWPDDTRTEYTYDVAQNTSADPKVATLATLTDSETNTYEFAHVFDDSVLVVTDIFWDYASDYSGSYESGSTDPDWGRRVLSMITLPDQETVNLSITRSNGYMQEGSSGNTYAGTLTTDITDACGNTWSYRFTQPEVFEHENYSASSAANHTVFYKRMEMVVPGDAGSEVFEYDADNMALLKTTDIHSNTTDYAYEDIFLEPVAQTNELDFVESYQYESSRGMREQSVDAENRKNVFVFTNGHRTQSSVYDAADNLVQKTSFEYGNAQFPYFVTRSTVTNLGLATDPAWGFDMVTESQPGSNGMLRVQTTDPDGLALTTTHNYDANNNQTRVVDANSHTNWFGYDEMNRLVAITNADFTVRSIGYDFNGNKIRETDENQNSTLFVYDTRNRLRHTGRDMDGNNQLERNGTDLVSSFTYNAVGSITSTIDPRGLVTTNLYDALQRLETTIVDPGGFAYSNHFEYGDNSGSPLIAPAWKPIRTTDPRGYKTFAQYDGLYRPTQTQQEIIIGGETTLAQMGYDKVGNLRFTTNWTDAATSQVTQIEYDALNRPVKAINPDTTETETLFTSTGLQWKSIDELNRETQTQYDHAGRPWKVIAPAVDGVSPTTETLYDAVGNVTNAINPRLISTTFEYDPRNRKTRDLLPIVWDEESQQNVQPTVVTYYDNVGNVAAVRDARQNLTTNLYDVANRVTNSILPEVAVYGGGTTNPSTSTAYDKNSNPTHVTDANEVVVQMQYDLLNRLTNTIDGELHSIGYRYDENGSRTKIIDQNTNETVFEYDGLNRNTKTTYADASFEKSGYDWIGNRIYREDAKTQRTDYGYDVRNRLDLVTYQGSGRTRDYQYDLVGNLTNVVESADSSANVAYTYDALNRVETETSVGVTHTYGYDLSGNRTNALYGITGRKINWVYDPHNRIVQITDQQGYAATINVSSGQNLQAAIDTASEGSLILVGDGTYAPIILTNAITVQSQNGPASTRIAGGSPARPATLTGNARLIGFTLSGGSLSGTNNGAGAFIGKGCLISDCVISNNQTALCTDVATPGGKGGGLYLRGTALRCTIENNTAWNGAGAYLEDGASMAGCTVTSNTASGVNSYGGGLYLQDGATAVNCAMANNAATDGGGLFFDNGGLAQGINSSSNTVDSIGGAGAFLWAGGTLRNGIIQANTATNTYARGGAGILFYDEGGLVEDSTIAGNLSVTNGGIHYRYSGIHDLGSLGTLNNSILWNNGTQTTVWSGTGNQTIDPSTTNSVTGADIPACPYASAGTRTTTYRYDLNGNPLRRTYPTGVVETRGFDALNRLQSFDVSVGGSSLFDIQYSYDAVGSAREMVQTSIGLEGQTLDATYVWEYDDRYRLTAETCTAGGSPASRTEFGLDPADNRLQKREYTGGVLQETTVYTPNNMNQMTGWTNSAKVVSYGFDDNGNRTNKTMMATGATNSVSTAYSYDEDNRLVAVALNDAPTNTHTFAYDYRSRRYHRSTPTGETLHIFDGGLCVQEYDATQSATPNAQSLYVEFIRGEGMGGGGVGGMVYSIRADGIRCSHANHRGDVVARTGSSGELTWIALYKAYGKRTQELGSNPDRQKANTNDEESDLDMVFVNMRIRCLESDVWLTGDPIGYADGPNRYCYVHANPITKFDPLGLQANITYGKPIWDRGAKGTGLFGSGWRRVTPVKIEVKVMFQNSSDFEKIKPDQVDKLTQAMEDKYTGTFGKYKVSTKITVVDTIKSHGLKEATEGGYNIIEFERDNNGRGSNGDTMGPKKNVVGVKVAAGGDRDLYSDNVKRTFQHEFGHVLGDTDVSEKGNIMRSGNRLRKGEEIDPKKDVHVREHNIQTMISNRKVNDVKKVPEITFDK